MSQHSCQRRLAFSANVNSHESKNSVSFTYARQTTIIWNNNVLEYSVSRLRSVLIVNYYIKAVFSARWAPANPAAVPKIIDITFPRGQARLSGHFFPFPTIWESRALPPFPLHVSPGVSLEEKLWMFRVKGGRWRCSRSAHLSTF